MKYIGLEVFLFYFFYFLLFRKWHLQDLSEYEFVKKLLNCSFCTSFWALFGVWSCTDLVEPQEVFIVPTLVMLLDLTVKKLSV